MNKFWERLSGDLLIVVLLGLVSTTTAWTAVQASLHDKRASFARSEYALVLADANNMYITAEVKYRDDLTVWKDKQVRHFIDGVAVDDLYSDLQTSNGSYELYTNAWACFVENPMSQLANCETYMTALYGPYDEMWASGDQYWESSISEGSYRNTLQMLTALFSVCLFLLGVTAVMKVKHLVAGLVMFSIVLWFTGLFTLFGIPTVFS
jgi:succinate dehydrogenase hydrophobic anchor subunit